MEKSVINCLPSNKRINVECLSLMEKEEQINSLLDEISTLLSNDNINYHWLATKFNLKETDLLIVLTKTQLTDVEMKFVDWCLLYLLQYKKQLDKKK